MENQSVKRGFWHKLFGTTPNDGNLQPREAIAYSITGIGQNFIGLFDAKIYYMGI